MENKPLPKPPWLKVKSSLGEENKKVTDLLRSLNLHTVCEEADCPNSGECFRKRTATFMILGKNCTRSCTFCTVSKDAPQPVDPDEPSRIAQAVQELGLRHVVITSVTRDDLPDGGASHFAQVISALKEMASPPVVEVLIPDFKGDFAALQTVIGAKPDIINHNVETVPRLYGEVRPEADYERSIELLLRVKQTAPGIATKSGVMLGLGETREEVLRVFADLVGAGCDMLTVGQYLAPSRAHHPVMEYIPPDVFDAYKKTGEDMGFTHVSSGPLVRSSYMADHAFGQSKIEKTGKDAKK
jgi:lipoic acid synthetase